jgi:hypothetical protein
MDTRPHDCALARTSQRLRRRLKPFRMDAAPALQGQLMSHGEQRKEYAAIFGERDEAFSGFVGVCPKVSCDECAFRGYRWP